MKVFFVVMMTSVFLLSANPVLAQAQESEGNTTQAVESNNEVRGGEATRAPSATYLRDRKKKKSGTNKERVVLKRDMVVYQKTFWIA